MPNETKNENSPSVENTNKGGKLLLGIGLLLILCNIVVAFGIGGRPNAWLFYLNVYYWPVFVSMFLWIGAIWIALESTEFMEDYLTIVRISAAICAILVVIYWLQSIFGIAFIPAGYPWWYYAIAIVVLCCTVRSLYLLYSYRYGSEGHIDLEEAQWFWGLSGFILAILATVGIMSVIPVKVPLHVGMDSYATQSLLMSCYHESLAMLRTGQGSLALRAFGLATIITAIAFVYVAGKWVVIFLSRFRGE